jgi:hypothetical protein
MGNNCGKFYDWLHLGSSEENVFTTWHLLMSLSCSCHLQQGDHILNTNTRNPYLHKNCGRAFSNRQRPSISIHECHISSHIICSFRTWTIFINNVPKNYVTCRNIFTLWTETKTRFFISANMKHADIHHPRWNNNLQNHHEGYSNAGF